MAIKAVQPLSTQYLFYIVSQPSYNFLFPGYRIFIKYTAISANIEWKISAFLHEENSWYFRSMSVTYFIIHVAIAFGDICDHDFGFRDVSLSISFIIIPGPDASPA
jgi:hypothetical protein